MDETVVGAAPARWTMAGMKREDGMQGCNIPNFQFGMLYTRSSLHIIFYCILADPRKYCATQGPSKRVGHFIIFIFEFSQILKIGSFDFIYFIFAYFYYKNMREGIK